MNESQRSGELAKRQELLHTQSEVCGEYSGSTQEDFGDRRSPISEVNSSSRKNSLEPSKTISLESTSRINTRGDSHSDSSSGRTSQLGHDLERLSLLSGNATQEAELYFLIKENEKLKQALESRRLTYDDIKNDDQLINSYTGIPNSYLFETLYSLFSEITLNYVYGWTVGIIPKKDQLLLTLMKLRVNLLNVDLACRFNCSRTTIAQVISTWILALHEILFLQLLKDIPSREKNKLCMPSCFSTFTNCRIVLDCTEVKCDRPTSMDKQRLTYSSYKHQNTFKGLIGVAPNGVVTFVSELYPGSTSDKKIVEDCDILNQMVAGDLILADKGFLIKDLLPNGVSLNIPPFLTTAQFTDQQVIQTRTIARARIHVERAIRRVKCFSILHSIPKSLASQASNIFQVCGALTNFQFPLIAEVTDSYESD